MKHLATLLMLAACGADVPANPTYFADVQPILSANCARCHGADPADPKIADFRLDRYVAGDTSTLDAYDYSIGLDPAMARVAVDMSTPAMPPDYALTDRQREILARWIANDAPKGTRKNRMPQLELFSPIGATTADERIDTVFRTWDDDHDGLIVQLWVRDFNGERIAMGAQTGGGLRAISIDSATLAHRHTFEIYAVVDDGDSDTPTENKHELVLIPEIFIDHGARLTAPTVRLLAPNANTTEVGELQIAWTATDPDLAADGVTPDALTINLTLVQLANGVEVGVQPIANGIPNTGTFTWPIPSSLATHDASGDAIPYRVRVSAEDTLGSPHNIRTDESDLDFFVEQQLPTDYTWQHVYPIMDRYCKKCHGAQGATPAIDDGCLLQYVKGENTSLCEATDVGAFEKRSTIFTKMVNARTMPPAAEPQPSEAEIDLVAKWIQGGAPYGTGTTNAAPNFSWAAPTNNDPLVASNGMATLRWRVTDAMALAADAIHYAKFGTTGPNCTVNCTTMTAMITESEWQSKPVTMGMFTGTDQVRSFTWTAPEGAGCYCVRGTATDSAAQSYSVVAGKAVKF